MAAFQRRSQPWRPTLLQPHRCRPHRLFPGHPALLHFPTEQTHNPCIPTCMGQLERLLHERPALHVADRQSAQRRAVSQLEFCSDTQSVACSGMADPSLLR
jgi:hypothetical protein